MKRATIRRREPDVVPDSIRLLVLDRAGCRCEICGTDLTVSRWDLHHRRPRGMGGSRNPARHSPAGLLALCRKCHDFVERHRNDARGFGWLVPSWSYPATEPVRLHGRGWCLLLTDGTARPVEVNP